VQRWYVPFSSIHTMHNNVYLLYKFCGNLTRFCTPFHSFSETCPKKTESLKVTKGIKRNKKECKYVTKFYIIMFSKFVMTMGI
jgi:hypothetical protein